MITVHAGLHKTGSTSIQTALRLAQGQAGLQVLTPVPSRMLEDPDYGARLRALAGSRHVVISDEGLLGDPDDAYEQAHARIQILNGALGGIEHELILYVRPQLTWLPSVYLQLVQQGRSMSPWGFWEGIRDQPNLQWARLVDLVTSESAAMRVAVRAFNPGRDVVDDFFACAGLPEPPRPVRFGIRENVSIAAVQAPILAALNSDPSLGSQERLHLRHVFQDRLAAGAPPGLSPFPFDLQAEIAGRFRGDWSDLASALATTDPREATVFQEAAGIWDAGPTEFAGAALGDPLIESEILRTLRVLSAQAPAPVSSGMPTRLMAKLRTNPRDLPASISRALRRSSGA